MKVVNSPVFEESDLSAGVTGLFRYDVCAARSNVGVTIRSDQAAMDNITAYGRDILLTLRSNINQYLLDVRAVTGADPNVAIEDVTGVGYNYSGKYRVSLILTSAGGNTQVVLSSIGSESPTYYGEKQFGEDNTSQFVYRHRTRYSIQIIDVTPVDGVSRNIILAERMQNSSIFGYASVNLSETALGYLEGTGGILVKAHITETDFFNNSEVLDTDSIVFVDARNPDVNYGLYTMFNPTDGGKLLPSTGRSVIYNNDTVYPFYVNFVCNEAVEDSNSNTRIHIRLKGRDGTELTTITQDVDISIGLNCIDLSKIQSFIYEISARNAYSIDIWIERSFWSGVFGEFDGREFTDEFLISSGTPGLRVSGVTEVPCRYHVLNDRRDFYFTYQNSIGGISCMLTENYRRMTLSELSALRNSSTISNTVSRATESVELIFDRVDLSTVRFLTGYDLRESYKYDGIFESGNVDRFTSDGQRITWIVQQKEYEVQNRDLYRDLSLVIYRPIGMGANNNAVRLTYNVPGATPSRVVETYTFGARVVLKTPDQLGIRLPSDMVFNSWLFGNSVVTEMTMVRDVEVLASDRLPENYSLFYTIPGASPETVIESYVQGSTVTVKTPDELGMVLPEWKDFNGWMVNGNIVGSTIVLNSNVTLMGVLVDTPEYPVTYTLTGATPGTIVENYRRGMSTVVKSPSELGMTIPAYNYFLGWKMDGNPVNIGDPIIVNSSVNITSDLFAQENFQIRVSVPDDRYFGFGTASGTSFEVDWGDGSAKQMYSGVAIRHTYPSAGEYIVTMRMINYSTRPNFQYSTSGTAGRFQTRVTAVLSWGNGWIDYPSFDLQVSNLSSIPGLINPDFVGSNGSFNSSKITSIPDNLFSLYSPESAITSVRQWFYNCASLTSIPDGLFTPVAPLITSYYSAFNGCTGLTGSTPTVKGLKLWQLAGTPGFPNTIDGSGCFRGCTGLTDYNDIPSTWL